MRFIDHVDCINVTYSPDMIAKAFSSLARTRYAVFLCAGSSVQARSRSAVGARYARISAIEPKRDHRARIVIQLCDVNDIVE